MREHLPGAFAARGAAESLPTCEVITLAQGDPLQVPRVRPAAPVVLPDATDTAAAAEQIEGRGAEIPDGELPERHYLRLLRMSDSSQLWRPMKLAGVALWYDARYMGLRRGDETKLVLATPPRRLRR
jgi:hypothetical protein